MVKGTEKFDTEEKIRPYVNTKVLSWWQLAEPDSIVAVENRKQVSTGGRLLLTLEEDDWYLSSTLCCTLQLGNGGIHLAVCNYT